MDLATFKTQRSILKQRFHSLVEKQSDIAKANEHAQEYHSLRDKYTLLINEKNKFVDTWWSLARVNILLGVFLFLIWYQYGSRFKLTDTIQASPAYQATKRVIQNNLNMNVDFLFNNRFSGAPMMHRIQQQAVPRMRARFLDPAARTNPY